MLLKAQRFLGTADGIVEDFSMWPNVKPGANYWVKPIKGRIKKRMIVLAIAKRSWMGRNKRLIRNYIVKRVKEVKSDGRIDLRGDNASISLDSRDEKVGLFHPDRIVGEVILY